MWVYIIWGVILLLVITMLVRLRSLSSTYHCPKCEEKFRLTPLKEFIFPQVLYKKIVRCPNCRKVVAANIINSQQNTNPQTPSTQTKGDQNKNKTQNKRKVKKK